MLAGHSSAIHTQETLTYLNSIYINTWIIGTPNAVTGNAKENDPVDVCRGFVLGFLLI